MSAANDERDWQSLVRSASIIEGQNTKPPRMGDDFDGHPVVMEAWWALRHFGASMDRAQAVILLAMWCHRGELSEREYRAVLRRFPVPDNVPPGSWLFMLDEDPGTPEA